MRHPCSFLDYIDFSVDLSELIKIYHEKNICYKIHKILMERVKKLLTVRDRRDIVVDTCEKGLFSAARIRCPGGGPLYLRDTGRQQPDIHRGFGAQLRPWRWISA